MRTTADLTARHGPLWSPAMRKDAPQNDNPPTAAQSPDKALKKPPTPLKGGKEKKEARLAAALRENLRRRKAAQRKETD